MLRATLIALAAVQNSTSRYVLHDAASIPFFLLSYFDFMKMTGVRE